MVDQMAPAELAEMVSELDTDDAVDILEDLDEDTQQQVLDNLPAEDRVFLEQGLTFPEDSAGRLMQRELVAIAAALECRRDRRLSAQRRGSAGRFLRSLRRGCGCNKPVGSVAAVARHALEARRPTSPTSWMRSCAWCRPIPTRKRSPISSANTRLVSAPVVDGGGRLIGVITVDDVVRVIDEEAEEDLLNIVGVGDTDFHAPAHNIGLPARALAGGDPGQHAHRLRS